MINQKLIRGINYIENIIFHDQIGKIINLGGKKLKGHYDEICCIKFLKNWIVTASEQ